jgi:NTP pyrophosphatase (non-canonical NTP hydrolase)
MRELKDSIDKNEAVIELDRAEQYLLYACLNELRDFRWGDKNDFYEYQKQAIEFDTERFAIGQEAKWRGFVEKALGLSGEAGEVAEKIKKIVRDQNMNLTEDDKEAIKLELGDVLWYLSAISFYLSISLEEVAKVNLEKLNSRKARGKIHGSGDDR